MLFDFTCYACGNQKHVRLEGGSFGNEILCSCGKSMQKGEAVREALPVHDPQLDATLNADMRSRGQTDQERQELRS